MEKHSDEAYKRYTMLLLIAAAAALVVCAAAMSLKRDSEAAMANAEQSLSGYYISKQGASQENSELVSGHSMQKNEKIYDEREKYFITIHDGKIGVFKSGEKKPYLTADVDVYLLPGEDLAILRKGLYAHGISEVKSILEDYE